MTLIADILMAAGAFGAALYCSILSARLKRFSTLESGMGGAIAVLSVQVDDMTRALQTAQGAASESTERLQILTQRAESVSAKLELMVAAMHGLPETTDAPEPDETGASTASDRRMRYVRSRVGRDRLEAAE
jgi:Domain of unknown function (DUF6468)